MIERTQTDVLVLGGGPAGSTAAALLAGRGVRTILADRDLFPRDKLCGEFLSYDAIPILDFLGVTDRIAMAGATTIECCIITGTLGSFEFPLPLAARGVSRLLLDKTLLDRARQSGAEVMEGWTGESIARQGDRTEVELSDQTQSRRLIIEAAVVIGAWGRWGRFDQKLGRSFVHERARRHFGFKRHYEQRAGDLGAIRLYSFDQGYLGVSPIEGGQTNICGLVHASRIERMKGGWQGFVDRISLERPLLRELYSREATQKDFLSSEPVIFRAKSPIEQGLFLVGDAAGLIDPLTGNGMAMAIQSGLVAADAILDFLQHGKDRAASEQRYLAAYRSMFLPRIRWSRRAAFLLSRPDWIDRLIRVAPKRAGSFFLDRTRGSSEDVQRLVDVWAGNAAQDC